MLFDIPKLTDAYLLKIESDYTVLHFNEIPMLFSGKNKYGNRIVGSIMCEDEDNDIERYLYILVLEADYIKFIKRKISYMKLIEKQTQVFIIDKNSDGTKKIYCLHLSEIPPCYLPNDKIFCPVQK